MSDAGNSGLYPRATGEWGIASWNWRLDEGIFSDNPSNWSLRLRCSGDGNFSGNRQSTFIIRGMHNRRWDAVRVPIPEVLDDLSSVVDEVLLVEDNALIEAMQLAYRHHGLVLAPAGAAALAAAVTYKGRFRGGRVALPLCGGNLTEAQAQEWLFMRTP